MMLMTTAVMFAGVTATWSFRNPIPEALADLNLQGASGTATLPSDVEGITCNVDATNGKLYTTGRGDWAQFNTGTLIQVPVKSNKDVIEVQTYSAGSAKIGGQTVADKEGSYKASQADVVAGYVVVEAVANDYLGYIKVTQNEVDPAEKPLYFGLILNNQEGSFVAAEDQSQGKEFTYGIAIAADGTVSRVAADAENAVATISGKFHSEHGCENVVLTVPVKGYTLITAGACTYGNHTVTITDAAGEKTTFDTPGTCWKNDRTVAKGYYKGNAATTLTINGTSYLPYIAVEEVDELPAAVRINYSLGDVEAEGTVPAGAEVDYQADYTIAKNFTLYKEGYTLTGWTDGNNTYSVGSTINPSTDLELTPVFKANVNSFDKLQVATSIVWTFRRDQGAPVVHAEGTGKSFWYVAQASVDGEIQDVAMYCDVEHGKISNANNGDWAQVNSGAKMTVKAAKGATVTVETYKAIAATTFNGKAAEGNTATTYTYTEEEDVDSCVIAVADGDYYRTVTVNLPANYVPSTKDPVKFELILNNSLLSFIAEEDQKENKEFSYGIAMAADGTPIRVAPDAANAIATITGKFYNDHGSTGVVLTVPVQGPAMITVGACSYGSHTVTIADEAGNTTTFDTPAKCWKNDKTTAKGYYKGNAPTVLTITGTTYMPYIAVEEVAELPSTVKVTYAMGNAEAEGTLPAAVEVGFQEEYAIAKNFTLYKEGYTLIGWNDGNKTHKPGDIIKPEEDITLTPIFKANANSFASLHEAATIVWDFQQKSGAPVLAAEGAAKNFKYVAQTLVDGETQDVAMYCDVTSGKIANGNWNDWAQVNGGTKLTVKSAKGATITVETYNPIVATTFNGKAAEGNTATTYTYTEEEDADSCVIVVADGSYYRTVTVVLPANYVAPSGDKFENTSVSFAWAVGNESSPVISDGLKILSQSKVSVGSDIEVSGPSTYSDIAGSGSYMVYRPNTTNPGCVATDMIEYTINMAKDLTLTPTSISFDAVKEGTDNAYFSWSYVLDGVESSIVAYSDPKNQIRRNNNANPSAPLTHVEKIADNSGCKVFKLRFYISNVADNKKMAIGNIKINGTVDGELIPREFKNFKVDFRSEEYKVIEPASGVLPLGVTISGTYHDPQHGYNTTTIVVPCDGPVKFTLGSCNYGGKSAVVKNEKGEQIATIDCMKGCDSNTSCDKYVVWYYNDTVAQTLTFTTADYIPFFYAEACDLLPNVTVSYYDTDGSTLLGKETVEGGSLLKYAVSVDKVTVGEGKKFRGWFNSTQNSALKIAEGIMLQEDLKLYARATEIEVANHTSRYVYDLTKSSFDPEDHECLELEGRFNDLQHGWNVSQVRVHVGGKAYIGIGCCVYTNASTATITGADGKEYGTFEAKAETDGAEVNFQYDGPEQWLTITFPATTYVHNVSISNVVDFIQFDEATGYYIIASSDVSSFLIALASANASGNVKIFLPNGTYNLGETALTQISGNNISIIGESMEGTIIINAPAKENEGIGTTATLLNTSSELYLQDLTLQNALDYYATGAAGRAVCLQDMGRKTICKNVRMLSYQDTYYSNRASQFYWEDSEIHGTVDYLCGDGDVIYNRVKLVNESRTRTPGGGDCTVCAPYTDAGCKWGYVFMDCTIETLSAGFNLGRSWGGESKATYLNTVINQPSKLASSRWTTAGMNVAAFSFKEYNTMDVDGNVISPASNELNFTHSSGNRTYETMLTPDEAAKYTIANIHGTWAPDQIAAQVTDVAEGKVFLVDGKITTELPTSGKVRIANARGGFGPEVDAVTAIETVKAEQQNASSETFDLMGRKVQAPKAGMLYIQNGKSFIQR